MVGLWNSHKFVWDLNCEINIKIAVFVLCLAKGLTRNSYLPSCHDMKEVHTHGVKIDSLSGENLTYNTEYISILSSRVGGTWRSLGYIGTL